MAICAKSKLPASDAMQVIMEVIQGGRMRHAAVMFIIAMIVLAALPASAQAPKAAPAPAAKAPAGKAWAPVKTPWGDPDLQGIWTSDDCIGTAMNRPANLGDKLY